MVKKGKIHDISHDKDMEYLKDALHQILQNQIYGVAREAILPGFGTPLAGAQYPVFPPTTLVLEQYVREGTTGPPGLETQNQESEVRNTNLGFEQRSDSPRFQQEYPSKKVDLPLYEGTNPEDWLFRVEKCFVMNRTNESEKLNQTLACLIGTTITWWIYSQDRERIENWKEFKDKFKIRFRPSRGISSVDHLLNIVQT
ncbi:hypothetical protein V5N11_000928 [Cardamine amara subsp. amara]|uniref:Retrotransposon gag domain-containing protein n=1 Tax=Cardamine amara subsp. amara TaxID=228776 RepID=A0ABD1C556_CARAN